MNLWQRKLSKYLAALTLPKQEATPFGDSFQHPLGGGELPFRTQITKADAACVIRENQPNDCDWSRTSVDAEKQARAEFFVHWRLWRQRCTKQHSDYAHIPACRPDETIWTRSSIQSALESCMRIEEKVDGVEKRQLQPSFLLIQIGPVQEFIAQARSTRDLWSGSYLLSWLIAHGIKAVTDEIGPDCVLFPSLCGQPLYDFLHKERLYDKLGIWNELSHAEEHILTPNLPNRSLALVPSWRAKQLAEAAEKAMTAELQRIGNTCANWLEVEAAALPRWNQQIRQFLTLHWQCYAWDSKSGKVDDPDFSLTWAKSYAEVDRLLAARRNTRDFNAWAASDLHRAGAVKDILSGKEEVIGSEPWQEKLPDNIKGHHFKPGEKLGAMNLIKRIWQIAYLQKEYGLKRTPRFDSSPAVAATPHANKMWADPSAAEFLHLAHNADAYFENGSDDASVFHLSEWERAIKTETKRKSGQRREAMDALQAARDALKKLGGAPGRYVAVLAMDGDSMGEWVSGAKSPHWRSQLAPAAVEYFEQHPKLAALLDAPRHASPSYHLQLSEALANFALYLAGPIVECFDGQIIYAGGDDVLAMLPAEKALPCAHALRMAFRGDPNLWRAFDSNEVFDEQTSPSPVLPGREGQDGFVGMNANAEIFKRTKRFVPRGYPLLVPGSKADISAGIAIGHMHSPLQNLVEAARQAEKRAKTEYGKAAFAISLFKRSGETIQWGAKWDSRAIELAQSFAENSGEGKPLAAKFPYALAQLLRAYAIDDSFRIAKTNGFDPFAVFSVEIAHCLSQQGKGVPEDFLDLTGGYLKQCENRRLDDFLGPFLTTTFINRGGGE